jgi:hypothetical protein
MHGAQSSHMRSLQRRIVCINLLFARIHHWQIYVLSSTETSDIVTLNKHHTQVVSNKIYHILKCVNFFFIIYNSEPNSHTSSTLSLSFSLFLAPTLEHRESVKGFAPLQLNLEQSVGLLGRWISPSQERCLYTHRINAGKHPCLEWDSNPWSQCSSGRRQFML